METEVQTELKPAYAQVCCRGIANAVDTLKAIEVAFLLAASRGRKAILFDVLGLTGQPFGTMDRYAGGTLIAELTQDFGKDIAFAFLGNEPMVDRQRFGETVARNRGGRVRAFLDINEAVGWIEEFTSTAQAPWRFRGPVAQRSTSSVAPFSGQKRIRLNTVAKYEPS